jgi:hypothetical protein
MFDSNGVPVEHRLLSREGVERLTRHCPELTDQEIYGDDLGSLMGGFPHAWLEAALLAGYVPDVWAGPLAIRAYHTWIQEQIDRDERQELDAVGWTQVADAYREMIGMLEGFVIEMEERRAAYDGQGPLTLDTARRARWFEDSREADARAAHARERRASAEADNRRAKELRDRYSATD